LWPYFAKSGMLLRFKSSGTKDASSTQAVIDRDDDACTSRRARVQPSDLFLLIEAVIRYKIRIEVIFDPCKHCAGGYRLSVCCKRRKSRIRDSSVWSMAQILRCLCPISLARGLPFESRFDSQFGGSADFGSGFNFSLRLLWSEVSARNACRMQRPRICTYF
jgi:hypothetical protein